MKKLLITLSASLLAVLPVAGVASAQTYPFSTDTIYVRRVLKNGDLARRVKISPQKAYNPCPFKGLKKGDKLRIGDGHGNRIQLKVTAQTAREYRANCN